jgi:hypothetical protein
MKHASGVSIRDVATYFPDNRRLTAAKRVTPWPPGAGNPAPRVQWTPPGRGCFFPVESNTVVKWCKNYIGFDRRVVRVPKDANCLRIRTGPGCSYAPGMLQRNPAAGLPEQVRE